MENETRIATADVGTTQLYCLSKCGKQTSHTTHFDTGLNISYRCSECEQWTFA